MLNKISSSTTPFFRYYLSSVFVISNLILLVGTFFFFPEKYEDSLLSFIPFWVPITSICSYFLFRLRDVFFTETYLIIKNREDSSINLENIYSIKRFQNYYSIHYWETGNKKWVLVLSKNLAYVPFATGDVKAIVDLKKAIKKSKSKYIATPSFPA